MNLTQTAKVTRRAVAAFVVLIALLFVGRLGWNVGLAVYHQFFPPEKPPPETEFGKIALPQIGGIGIDTSEWTFELDTPSGRLPHTPDRLPVFPLEKPGSTPLTEQEAQSLAQSLGFFSQPQALTAARFRWQTGERTLEMNVVSQAFTLESDPNILEMQLSRGESPIKSRTGSLVLGFLNRLELSNSTLKSARKEFSYLEIDRGNLKEVESISQAHLTRVDLFKAVAVDGKNYNVYGPNPHQGLTYVAVSGITTNQFYKRVPFARYQNWEIKTDNGSTYPLISSTQAWKILENGDTALVYLKPQNAGLYQEPSPPNVEKIRIQEINLAYFESESPQRYLAPVYVLKGLAEVKGEPAWEVVFYVHGVAEEWQKE